MLHPERFKYKLNAPVDIIHQPHWYKAKQRESRAGVEYQIPSEYLDSLSDKDQHTNCTICSYSPWEAPENQIKMLRKTIAIREQDIENHKDFFTNLSSSGLFDENFDEEESESSDDEYIDLVNVKERILNWLPEENIEDKIKNKDHYYRVEYKDVDGKIKEKVDHYENLKVYEIERLFRKCIK
eukprot:GAHX01001016.1.p1 GENE.GAHX01001016.1~~GAHX01001016.1.p1  ORF type:complete len:183 (-),score=41.27 GAHX01001016.1:1277-1825(-)